MSSNFQGIKNLKELYSYKIPNKNQEAQNLSSITGRKSRIPMFSQTKQQFMVQNSGLPSQMQSPKVKLLKQHSNSQYVGHNQMMQGQNQLMNSFIKQEEEEPPNPMQQQINQGMQFSKSQHIFSRSNRKDSNGTAKFEINQNLTNKSKQLPDYSFREKKEGGGLTNNMSERNLLKEYPIIEKSKGSPFLNYVFAQQEQVNQVQPVQFKINSSRQLNKNINLNEKKDSSSSLLKKGDQSLGRQDLSERRNMSNNSRMNDKQQDPLEKSDHFEMMSQETIQAQMAINQQLNKNNFIYHFVIGKGGFGKVWKVQNKKNKKFYAMKEMAKSKIITKRSINSVMSEKSLLSQLQHPFIVNMNLAFQDRDNLYLLMDLLTGGDLRYHIGKHRRFKEVQTRFFVANIFLGLEYLHKNNIIHRDIKPENLVLENDGITDLGIARFQKPDNSQDTSGTPGYMAPEVMCRQNHTIAVDYFAVGVIGYEFMMGRRPYLGRSRKEIRDQILAKQVQIKQHEIPEGWSLEAADFINRCLIRKPQYRLGWNGPDEVKNHPWLKNFPFHLLYTKEIDSPFKPGSIEENYDYRQQISTTMKDSNEDKIQEQNQLLLRRNSVQNLFIGYNFDGQKQIISQQTKSTQGSQYTTILTQNQLYNLERHQSQHQNLERHQSQHQLVNNISQQEMRKNN